MGSHKYMKLFTTPTCGACKIMKRYLGTLDTIVWHEIMLDDTTQSIFDEYEIKAAPTVLLYEGDKLIEKREGYVTQAEIQDFFKEMK